ncbi:HIT family protein [Ideonella sp.]|uniref:HIT family protein n=1 Tax=Ideonella sp. TaxID=1929293 RepID=UPI00351BE89C
MTAATPALFRHPGCALCEPAAAGTALRIAEDARLQVIRVLDAPDFPAFYRVIWHSHVAEFSGLNAADRLHCMDVVAAVEQALIETLAPTKVNLAALGNMVPHLHWHVIARFNWDAQFPQPIWGAKQREVADAAARLAVPLATLDQRVRAAVGPLLGR